MRRQCFPVFGHIYTAVTHHNEFALIKAQNSAAGVALTGSLLGFVIAISRLIENSVAIVEFAMWAVVAIVVQIIVYGLVRLTCPQLSERIENGELEIASANYSNIRILTIPAANGPDTKQGFARLHDR